MSYLGDIPETNFKQAQLIHLSTLPEEYRDPSTESALAQKLGVWGQQIPRQGTKLQEAWVPGEGQYTSPRRTSTREDHVEAESVVLWVMPGDMIEWEVEISSQSRIHMVHAFFKETEDPTPRQLALGGEVYT